MRGLVHGFRCNSPHRHQRTLQNLRKVTPASASMTDRAPAQLKIKEEAARSQMENDEERLKAVVEEVVITELGTMIMPIYHNHNS
jgi:hypothetical protein